MNVEQIREAAQSVRTSGGAAVYLSPDAVEALCEVYDAAERHASDYLDGCAVCEALSYVRGPQDD